MNLTQIIERTLFWWRTRRLARDWNAAIAARKRRREVLRPSALKGWETRNRKHLEGLKR